MRVWSRIALVVVILLSAFGAAADHSRAECPLSLADTAPSVTEFGLSPHGVFRYGSQLYVLRGQVLTTFAVNGVGNMSVGREDYIATLGAREAEGGVAFSEGYLYVSGESGLEIYDLRNVQAGGNAPILLSRTAGLHYRRLAVSGNRLAALFPSTDMSCYPRPGAINCLNAIDLWDISIRTAPVKLGSISSGANALYRGFNDIAFNHGNLMAVSEQSLVAFDITNPAAPVRLANVANPGRWLVSNGTDFLAVGNDYAINIYRVQPGISPYFMSTRYLTIPSYLAIERANAIRFNRTAWYDDANGQLITMIDEVDPLTRLAARTIAFDVFDFSAPFLEGSAERIYEDVTFITDDEVKHNPVAVGGYVYVIGERTGVQSWGSCGVVTGRIELESPFHLTCNGSEIHGWVAGQQRIVNVELFLDNQPLGSATVGGPPRNDVSSSVPVTPWRINVNLDQMARGEYNLRAVATDRLGNRRQFASKRLFFQGPGQNCSVPRRRSAR
jgi:hypothetical protein